MTLSSQQVTAFQEKLLLWFGENKRELPWRTLSYDKKLKQREPYKILISEIMSQQTQLSRVIPKYEAWLKKLPTIQSLAEAPLSKVVALWSGLGYNRRAINLHKAAMLLLSEYSENSIHQRIKKSDRQKVRSNGLSEFTSVVNWPRTYKELVRLPGVGKYTANALLCFAFNKEVVVVDTNVRKVILVEILKVPLSKQHAIPDKIIEEIACQLLPKGRAYEWNQALMDYAALTLKKEKILVAKQAPYRTSRRYYRGKILQELVRKHTVTFVDLWQYFAQENPITKEELRDILRILEQEGLIQQRSGVITIA